MLDCLAAPGDGAGCVFRVLGRSSPPPARPSPGRKNGRGPGHPPGDMCPAYLASPSLRKHIAMKGKVRMAGQPRAWRGRRRLVFLCLTSVVPDGRCSLAATPLDGRGSRALCSFLATAAMTAAVRFHHRSYYVTPEHVGYRLRSASVSTAADPKWRS